jgi:hypothetical protein
LKGKAPSKSTTLHGRVEKEARESRRSQRAREKLERVAMEVLEDQDAGIPISEYIDLESLAFQQAGHLMSNKQCKLPQGTLKRSKKGYEESSVPALKPPRFREDEKLLAIKDLPEWLQPAFEGVRELNRIQSHCYKAFF